MEKRTLNRDDDDDAEQITNSYVQKANTVE